jgi:hypothetical protein
MVIATRSHSVIHFYRESFAYTEEPVSPWGAAGIEAGGNRSGRGEREQLCIVR